MSPRPSLRTVSETALDEVSALVGSPAEGVTGVRKIDDGWMVTIEVLEVARVPETTDVLGAYEVHVNEEGHVMEYTRLGRYLRSQVENVT
jgi:hypothetical protein